MQVSSREIPRCNNPLVTTEQVQQRDVWWVKLPPPDGKIRPCLVVSDDRVNSHPARLDILIVPLSGSIDPQQFHHQVVIPAGETGLDRDSITKVNRLQPIQRSQLVAWVTCLDDEVFQQVLHCIASYIGLSGRE